MFFLPRPPLFRPEEAAKQYQVALAADPTDFAVVRRAAEFCLQSGRAQMAQDPLNRVCQGQIEVEAEDLGWARRTLALSLSRQGGYPNLLRALALVEENLHADPSSTVDRCTKAILAPAQYRADRGRRSEVRRLEVLGQPGGAYPESRSPGQGT